MLLHLSLFADNQEQGCEKKYKKLLMEHESYVEEVKVQLYDYIESDMDRGKKLNDIKSCLKLETTVEIRTCIQPILK